MAQTSLNVQMDAGVMEQFEAVCDELGMSVETALMVFVKAFIREDGFPFDVNLTSPYKETLAAVEDVNNGRNLLGPFHSVEELKEELIGGEIVTMMAPASVNHNRISGNIYEIFKNYLRGKKCENFIDTGLRLAEDMEEYIPDGMVVCDPDKVGENSVTGAPDLVVEVLSRSTSRYDRGHKKDVYQCFGVREYWIADPFGLSVEQYVLENGKFTLRNVCHKYPASVLAEMKPKDRAEVVEEFQCAVFDLTIRMDDVFGRVIVNQ